MENNNLPLHCGGQFNTLAQRGTNKKRNHPVLISGKGSDLSKKNSLKGRAKRKMITQKMILSLIDVSENKHNPSRIKPYWNTFYCQNKVYTADGRLYGKYCKNRFCTLCASIRKAEIINRYLPTIQLWDDPYFVTLTIKAQPLRNLNKFMKGMIIAFNKITDKYRKRSQRGKGIKFVGIKSLECNFNPTKKTYNPHFHLVVQTKEMATILIDEWLKIWTRKYTFLGAQDLRRVGDREKILIEIIKYGSKIFTEPDLNKKMKAKEKHDIYAAALNNIFASMKGLRIFERFGFDLPILERNSKCYIIKNFDKWEFDNKIFDWINFETGEILTQYTPSSNLISLLEGNINRSLE